MPQKISRKVLPINTVVVGDVFIRGIRTRTGTDMVTYVIFDLGPTPHPIVDNPEEFSLSVSINVKLGMPFAKVVAAATEILKKGTDIYVSRTHVIQ